MTDTSLARTDTAIQHNSNAELKSLQTPGREQEPTNLNSDIGIETTVSTSEQRLKAAANHLAEGVCKQLQRQSIPCKVGVAQIKPLPTRLEENYNKIVAYIEKAKGQNVELLVFPELTIPGYLALDNFDNEVFVQANLQVLKRVIEHTTGSKMTVVCGFVNSEIDTNAEKRRHYNAAAIIKDGRLVDVVDKTLLPNDDIFWEARHFASAKERHSVSVDGTRLGVEICEDLWDNNYSIKVTDELSKNGADLLLNLSASPFQIGKYKTRHQLVSNAAQKHQKPFIYANMVGAQDGYEGEVVFDGRSMIVGADGNLLALGKPFEEELLVVDLHQAKKIELPSWAAVEEVHDALVLGLREYCARNGFKRVYIGESGGIDSAVVTAIAVEALGKENVIGVTMPSHITSDETKSDALLLAKNLGIRCDTRPIGKQFKAWEEDALKVHGQLASITKQNYQARLRGNILMEYTNEDRQGMVLTTGNKTEMGVGYCTLYGDMSGGLALIADLNKLMVYEIARFINTKTHREVIPASIIARAPTAELEPGQTDEANLPAPYHVLAPLVDELVEGQKPATKLLEEFPEKALRETAKLIRRAEYKRRQAAPGIRTTSKAFGAGRRFPVDDHFDELSFVDQYGLRKEALLNAKDLIAKP